MLRVSLDVDDVVANIDPVIIKYLNLIRGKVDWDRSRWEFSGGITKEIYMEIYKLVWHVHNDEIKSNVRKEKLRKFVKDFKVDLVTARADSDIPPLKEWLNRNFGELDINIINVKSVSEKLNLDYDIYIDDSPQAYDPNKNALFFIINKPWNERMILGGNAIKVNGLEEAIDFLENNKAILESGKIVNYIKKLYKY